jgi:hypothetical protein
VLTEFFDDARKIQQQGNEKLASATSTATRTDRIVSVSGGRRVEHVAPARDHTMTITINIIPTQGGPDRIVIAPFDQKLALTLAGPAMAEQVQRCLAESFQQNGT